MKKEVSILFLIALIALIFFSVYKINAETVTGSSVTGNTITGNATSESVAVSITIITVPTPGETPSGGGGGATTTGFSLSKNEIKVSLTPGEITTEAITITNIGNKKIRIDIENLREEFLILKENSFELNPGESKNLSVDIIAREDTVPNLYLGKLIIKSESQKKEILVAVEVESKGLLLDVRAEILDIYKRVSPGGEVLAEIRLFNLGGTDDKKDVLIEYIIKDYDNNSIATETESLAVQTQATFIKRISIPENAPLGLYVLYVRAIYDEKVASSSDNFEVIKVQGVINKETLYKIFISILIIIGISLIIRYIRKEKGKRKKKR